MRRANIVYWYGQSEMPRDGGGLRALAWHKALTDLGYESTIHPLRKVDAGEGNQGPLRSLKKQIIPMPLQGRLPKLPASELNVITVPSVFASAARSHPQSTLLFDWMDLWSVNAQTMAHSSRSMRAGGLAQSSWWKVLESRLPLKPAGNAFAGHDDFLSMSRGHDVPSAWLPTPVEWPQRPGPEVRRQPPTLPRRIGFLGNMNYAPNIVSLKKFLSQYADRLAPMGMELVVAGYGSEVVKTWTSMATVLGPVDDVADFYASVDAVIVPIDHGGGIKVKALEAMVHGVPVFGTEHVRSGFNPSFWEYIGDVNDLMKGGKATVKVAPARAVQSRFSETSFMDSVAELLGRSGF
ncbi:glycosyltransferase family 4 protein [Pseudarthrobacter oxydans]|uniref:glycosyltransferase family 4 protein n=1 Tax=Pseudarthrobacter oxydans TaxID=1671 RepID=UPI0027D90D0B|nr:glycosyltransferase family 4 protein [Pseudarthrobacter oxydans]